MGKKSKESSLATRLKQAREKAGISQQELAARSKLSIGVVSQIEQGRRKDPRVSTMQALALSLGVKIDDLLPSSEEAEDKEPADK